MTKVVAILVGCSMLVMCGEKNSEDKTPAPGQSGDIHNFHLCQANTSEDIQSFTNLRVVASTDSELNGMRSCQYSLEDTSIFLIQGWQKASAAEAQGACDVIRIQTGSYNGVVEDVAGIGDKAFYAVQGNNLAVLVVQRGRHCVTFTLLPPGTTLPREGVVSGGQGIALPPAVLTLEQQKDVTRKAALHTFAAIAP